MEESKAVWCRRRNDRTGRTDISVYGRTVGAGAGPCGEADGAGVWARSHGSTGFPVVTVWLPHCPGSAGSCEMRERFHLVEDWAWAQRPTMRSTPAPALRSA